MLTALATEAQQKDYPIQAVNFTAVKLTDSFWLPRIKLNYTATIPASFERCESTGRVKNFEMAAARSGKFCTTFPFDDTDIYKTIEGASFSLSLFPDPKLSVYMDSLIEKVRKAQEPDGYLYTARTIDPAHPQEWAGPERWVKERELSHELYNSGHLYEAAAAHYLATGKRNLLDIALKNADLVVSVFGPNKRHVAPGHQVVEIGLVKLYRITGKIEYLNTAKFFIDERGHYSGYDAKNKDPWKNGAYWQDHIPVVQQTEGLGHAVRAGYLYAAMADVAALTGDQDYLKAIDSIWNNIIGKKVYVQGGFGAVPSGERFGDNYELPNGTAYNETCAAIAQIFWNQRMFQLHGQSKYIDVLEKILYNGFISGLGLDGKSFFYTNAMEIRNGFHHHSQERQRSGWFECSCCPTNIVRLLPAIPGYVYAQKDDQLYANLFINGQAAITIKGKPVSITQENNYPWEGQLRFLVNPRSPLDFTFRLRLPGWAQGTAIPSDLYHFTQSGASPITITVNGQPVPYSVQDGYALLTRKWKKGDIVEMQLPMAVQTVKALEAVKADTGRVALQRGPLVYCGEWADNQGQVSNILLPAGTQFNPSYKPGLLHGVTVLEATVPVVQIGADGLSVSTRQQPFTAIPYYAWANRGLGEMSVWFPQKLAALELVPAK